MPTGWTPLSYTAMRQGDTTRCHAGHQFYKDGAGDWQDVDYALSDMGTYWELTKASYRLRIEKEFDAPTLITFTNKYEGADHVITYEPHSIWWVNADNKSQRTQFRTAQAVTGTLDAATNIITWPNAFGAGVDFEVVVQRSGFKKNIVAHAAPPAGPYTNNWLVPVFKWDAQGLTLKDANGGDWDNNSYFEADEFTVEETTNRQLRSHIQRAHGIDATGREKALRVMFEKRGGSLWQGKIIPENLLQQAVYPIRADTVTTFYSGAGDGRVWSYHASSWDSTHDATTGGGAPYTATTTVTRSDSGASGDFEISRVFLPFDTSSIPDGDTISAATLNNYVTNVDNDDNDGDDFITVVQTSQASTSTLSTSDFDQCGDAIDNPTEGINSGDRADLSSISTATYLSLPLNATGIGWIDKTGWTKLGMREGHDVVDSAIVGAVQSSDMVSSTSEETGTSQDPYLEVTHAAAASGNPWYAYAQQ